MLSKLLKFIVIVFCSIFITSPVQAANFKSQTVNDGQTQWTISSSVTAPKKGKCKNIKAQYKQIVPDYVKSEIGIMDNNSMLLGYAEVVLGFPGTPRSGTVKIKICSEPWKDGDFDLWGKAAAKKGTYDLIIQTVTMNGEIVTGQKISSIKIK